MPSASDTMPALARVRELFEDSIETKRRAAIALPEAVVAAAALLGRTLGRGGRVLACGNGGSAADAQHFAAELVNRFEAERDGLPGLALTVDGSVLTSIANDRRYEEVFSRQVEALGRAGDALVAISTSGASPSVVAAIAAARRRGLAVVLLSGRDGGACAGTLGEGDVEVRVPATSTARIQEVHLLVLHCLCDLIDRPPATRGEPSA